MYRLLVIACATLASSVAATGSAESLPNPYDIQVNDQLERLENSTPAVRASAAESLGLLRAYRSELPLLDRLNDPVAEVRREIAMALSWCGGRRSIAPLTRSLDDEDWTVR